MTSAIIDIRRKAFAKPDPKTGGDGTHVALKDLQFSVEAGEFVAITGPSGCGKTTLLNMIAGLDLDFEGDINLGSEMRDGMVYLFQTPRLLPWRTVLQNLTLVLADTNNAKDMARSLLRDVELEEFAESYPGQLSLGMQKRVALARAFALSPTLLLMDEPFSSLDPEAAARLRTLLVRLLASRTVTTLFVTHDHDEAFQLADRILEFSAPPASVLKDIRIAKNAKQAESAQ